MTHRVFTLALAFYALCVGRSASAHEVRPGYLEIRQANAETFHVLWKVPARADMRLAIHARFPENCRRVAEAVGLMIDDTYNERSILACQGGLEDRTITIDGLVATMTDVLVRLERENGSTQVVRLTPSGSSFVVEAAPSRIQVAATYFRLGVEHILFGIDHLLFVLALLILVKSGRRLVATVTSFTAAHSLTLAAATLGFVDVPQRPVEAVIALSIAFVATEIVRGWEGRSGLAGRWPWAPAFVFGLLHGFGFAGALREVGLPEQAIPLALLFFNVGVELGQLWFVSSVLVVVTLGRRFMARTLAWTYRLAPYGIGCFAAYWAIERVASFWR